MSWSDDKELSLEADIIGWNSLKKIVKFSKYIVIFIFLIEVVIFGWVLNLSQIKIIIIIKLCNI